MAYQKSRLVGPHGVPVLCLELRKTAVESTQKPIDEAVEKMTALEAEAATAWGMSLAKDKSWSIICPVSSVCWISRSCELKVC